LILAIKNKAGTWYQVRGRGIRGRIIQGDHFCVSVTALSGLFCM